MVQSRVAKSTKRTRSEKVSDSINQDEKKTAQEAMKSEEEKVMAKVDEVVGKEFKFRTMD